MFNFGIVHVCETSVGGKPCFWTVWLKNQHRPLHFTA